jgi:hypothetical protein
MSITARFNYTGVADSKDIADIFDYAAFLDHTKIISVIGDTTGNLDNTKVNTFINNLIAGCGNDYDKFVNNDTFTYLTTSNSSNQDGQSFLNVLFNTCYQLSFIPYIKAQSGYNTIDTALNISLTTALMNIFKASDLDWSDLSTVSIQMLALDKSYFMFGGITRDPNFNPDDYKKKVVPEIVKDFYPMIYYLHILKQKSYCTDFKCQRAYVLVKYVFIYYTFMILFESVFANSAALSYFASTLGQTVTQLDTMKTRMVLIMDHILFLLENENQLDVGTAAQVSSVTDYYNKIKTISDSNTKGSNTLNETKNTAVLMQNNLANYSNNEVVTYNRYVRERREFILTVIVMFFIISGIITAILMKLYTPVYVITGIVLSVLLINLTIELMKAKNII